MSTLEYTSLSKINPDDFICLLNKNRIRAHLIKHELFNMDTVHLWIKDKLKIDSIRGCRVRAVLSNNQLIGWCGIQLENEKHEVAIVIDDKHWGIGKAVFLEIICWAKGFGHNELLLHFHHTRPEYKFLRKISKNVYQSECLGSKFTTYQIALDKLVEKSINITFTPSFPNTPICLTRD